MYERLEIERAVPLLRQVVSPGWPFEVTAEQRVGAYTYLGACLSLVGKRDSAVLYFRAAVEREPFTDLDPRLFTPAQLDLFHRARRLTFAVAARPVAPSRIDPRTERLTLTVVTTHAASLHAELHNAVASSGVTLFDGKSDGLREIPWNGLLGDGRLAPPGRYELLVAARSRLLERADSARVYFDLRHDAGWGQRSCERRCWSTGALANGHLGGSLRAGAGIVAGGAAVTGGIAFLVRRHQSDIPANITANAHRRAARLAANEAIARRNAEKLAQTVLLITPAAGVGP